MRDVVSVKFLSVEYYLAFVGSCNLVEHSYQSRLSRSVRTEESVNALSRHFDTDIIQSFVIAVCLADVINLYETLHDLLV